MMWVSITLLVGGDDKNWFVLVSAVINIDLRHLTKWIYIMISIYVVYYIIYGGRKIM